MSSLFRLEHEWNAREKDEGMTTLYGDAVCSYEEAIAVMQQFDTDVIVGDGAPLLQRQAVDATPRVSGLIDALRERMKTQDWDPLKSLVPSYLRVSEAERKHQG